MNKPQFTLLPVSETATFGRFTIEPLPRGFGDTLGNALRRVLLSSIPGAAITSVKIAGVDHEFSTIANVMEDVIHILLNLKQVRFKLHSDESVAIKLSAKGEKRLRRLIFKRSLAKWKWSTPTYTSPL